MNTTLASGFNILLEKRQKLILPFKEGNQDADKAGLATFLKNIEGLGFSFTLEAIEELKKFNRNELHSIQSQIVPELKTLTGAHRQFRPMYSNFPHEVMEMGHVELYINALIHYITAALNPADPQVHKLFYRPAEARAVLPAEDIKLRLIGLGNIDELNQIFTQILGSNSSISERDKAIVEWFINEYKGTIVNFLPESIPQKEQIALLVSKALPYVHESQLVPYLKTATDVLRVAVGLSGGDVSLAAPTKFVRLGRKERRLILGALETCGPSLTEDMLRWSGRWVRLGERLHPGEFSKRYPKTYEAFSVIRQKKVFETFNSFVEKSLKSRKITAKLVTALKKRPGVFARRLDHMLRLTSTQKGQLNLIKKFSEVMDQISTPVLLQLHAHFKSRAVVRQRCFFPKGNIAKAFVANTLLDSLKKKTCDEIVNRIHACLVERFSALPPLGKVTIDEALRTQNVPFGLRSASKALKSYARGSRIALPDQNLIRLFLWWKNQECENEWDGRVDIDLSIACFDNRWSHYQDISFRDLRGTGGTHSGDITSAPEGACEFIDIDKSVMKENGIRYVVMSVNSYTEQLYKDLPECFAGWMARSEAQHGEAFDARTVENKIDLTSESGCIVPLVFDLETNEAVWLDVSMKTDGSWMQTSLNGRSSFMKMLPIMMTMPKPNLYDLFSMHAEARQSRHKNLSTVFSLNEGITPFNTELILSEYVK